MNVAGIQQPLSKSNNCASNASERFIKLTINWGSALENLANAPSYTGDTSKGGVLNDSIFILTSS